MKKSIIVWGTGQAAEDMVDKCFLFDLFLVKGFIDNDSKKWGLSFRGVNVYSPSILKDIRTDRILIAVCDWMGIYKQIQEEYPEKLEITRNIQYIYRKCLYSRYSDSSDPEIQQILEYVKEKGIDFMPYSFKEKYTGKRIEVFFDTTCGLYYVIHKEKRLYFSRRFNDENLIREYYRGLLIEQDIQSPHRYLTDDYNVDDGDIVVDCGVAEGNFALDVVERVKKVYLIESDDSWIEALEKTFCMYSDKVIIINKNLSSVCMDRYVNLNSLVDEPIDFLKMDIEGNEWEALRGGDKVIKRSPSIKMSICSYHRPYDEMLIKAILHEYGVNTVCSRGYLWFSGFIGQSPWFPTDLVRGIVRGKKE